MWWRSGRSSWVTSVWWRSGRSSRETSDGIGRHGLFPTHVGTTNLPWAVMSSRGRVLRPCLSSVWWRSGRSSRETSGGIGRHGLFPTHVGTTNLPWAVMSSRGRGSHTLPLIRVVALWPILTGWAIRPSHSYQTVQRLYCLLVPGIEPGRYGNYRAHRAGC